MNLRARLVVPVVCVVLALAISLLPRASTARDDAPPPNTELSAREQAEVAELMREFERSLDYHDGVISVAGPNAEFALDSSFRFLGREDAQRILQEVWGNPPDESVEGLIVPAHFGPFDPEAWAVVLQYEEDGYVSDADASEVDYSELLEAMKQEARDSNEMRKEHGYETIEIVGWAEPPHYDAETHKLYWAKEIAFEGSPQNTLNYNIRALGRRGVLVLNAVGSMDQIATIRDSMQELLPMISFEEGSRYVDFDPDVDTVAAYGIGALVAGKLAAKAGLLAKLAPLLLVFKKFGIFIVVGIGAFVRQLLGRAKKSGSAGEDSTPIA